MSEHDLLAHSRFGGSSATRWLNCAGSAALCATMPERPDSPYALEGTHAHALAEYCLKNGEYDANAFVHSNLPLGVDLAEGISGKVCGQNMVDAVNVYLDAVYEELSATKDAELYVEQRFKLDCPSAQEGEVFGSNDAMVYHPSTGRLVVFDYKHGVGVSVKADDNDQLKFYACGAALSRPDWKISEVILVVVQPRARDVDELGAVRPWPMDIVDLIEFPARCDAAIKLALAEEWAFKEQAKTGNVSLALAPGAWCRWCDAAAICPAKEQQIMAATGLEAVSIVDVTVKDLPLPSEMDPARLAKVLEAAEILDGWIGKVREQVDALLRAGTHVPGWKLAEKIGRRKWTANDGDVASYVNLLYDIPVADVMPPKLVTITEMEKQIKARLSDKAARKEALDDLSLRYTIKDSSGLTLARENDRRDAVDPTKRDFNVPVDLT